MIARILAATTVMLTMAGASFAQPSNPAAQTTPNITPQSPSITPAPPSITSSTPVLAPLPGGLSKCENLIGLERDKCLQDERAGTASTGGRAAGAGTMGSQNTAPAGTVR